MHSHAEHGNEGRPSRPGRSSHRVRLLKRGEFFDGVGLFQQPGRGRGQLRDQLLGVDISADLRYLQWQLTKLTAAREQADIARMAARFDR